MFIYVSDVCKLFTHKDTKREKEIQWPHRFEFIINIVEVMDHNFK